MGVEVDQSDPIHRLLLIRAILFRYKKWPEPSKVHQFVSNCSAVRQVPLSTEAKAPPEADTMKYVLVVRVSEVLKKFWNIL